MASDRLGCSVPNGVHGSVVIMADGEGVVCISDELDCGVNRGDSLSNCCV